ncbi:MAG: ankyrin repeat domain-containing protein [Planctomycetota bacterium]
MTTEAQHSAFSSAIENGDIAVVRRLIHECLELVDHPDWVPPPIHCAVLWNQPLVIELLLDSGADIETLDPDRQTTALRYAIMYNRPDVIPLLISRGANSGPIAAGGLSALQLALECANGAYKQYEDLPARDEYAAVLALLKQYGHPNA